MYIVLTRQKRNLKQVFNNNVIMLKVGMSNRSIFITDRVPEYSVKV